MEEKEIVEKPKAGVHDYINVLCQKIEDVYGHRVDPTALIRLIESSDLSESTE